MFGFLKILAMIIDALPTVIKMIDIAEVAIGPGNGAQKLDMVKNTVQTAYTVSGEVESTFGAIWPVFETAIGHVVATKKQAAPVEQDPAQAVPVEQPSEHPYAPTAFDNNIML